jgi:hypothetical protein
VSCQGGVEYDAKTCSSDLFSNAASLFAKCACEPRRVPLGTSRSGGRHYGSDFGKLPRNSVRVRVSLVREAPFNRH